MNRSFKGRESLMPSIRQSFPQLRSELRDKEDDLGFFLELRKRDKDKNDLLNDTDELNDSLVSQPGSSPLFNIPTARKTGPDDFLSSECEKNDYDWLLTPPGTPLFPSLDMESKKAYVDEAEAPKARPTVLRSRLANSQLETTARSNSLPRPTASTGLSSSISGMRKPSPSGGPGSRSVTPTGRPILNSSKSSTPTSRATLPAKSVGHSSPKLTGSLSTRSSTPTRSAAKPAAPSTGPSRSSTPSKSTARSSTPTGATAPSAGPSRSSTPSKSTARSSMPTGSTAPSAGPSRSSTPSKSTARSSTPTATARPTAPTARPTSRTSTPTRRPSMPSSLSNAMSSASLNKSSSSLSSKSGSAPSRNPAPSRGAASPTVKSKSWNPSEMPGFSLDAPPNLRTTLPSRPLSATRGRPAAPSARSASLEPANNGRRRQSCSPSRGRSPSFHASGSSVPAVSRGHLKVNDDVSPGVIGTRMVERVVHMRKLMPPRQDDKQSPSLSGKSASSPDSSGFGRSLSKKSLDMAMRHMDIRRSIPGNLRPLMTKIPASSLYSVRSGATGNGIASISGSPIATNSNVSSEHGVYNHACALDKNRCEVEDDLQ